jgi:hypothetical protein
MSRGRTDNIGIGRSSTFWPCKHGYAITQPPVDRHRRVTTSRRQVDRFIARRDRNA